MYKDFLKRLFDFILSFFAIIVLSPIILILMIIGVFTMKGNPFFTQIRPGKNEKLFKLIKFRTMSNAKDKDGNLLPDELRLNKYGKFLRSTSLDELPELFNILKGDMAIVGPRPLLVKDMIFMSDEIRKRHSIRPGLTGLAQVNGRNIIGWDEKFNYDLKYLDDINVINDLKIIFKTVGKVLSRSDINREGTDSDIDYGDWLLKNNQITQEFYSETINKLNK